MRKEFRFLLAVALMALLLVVGGCITRSGEGQGATAVSTAPSADGQSATAVSSPPPAEMQSAADASSLPAVENQDDAAGQAVVALSTSSPTQDQNAEIELAVHYYRYDGDYTGWNLWVWIDGKEGTGYEFTEEDDYGLVAHVPLTGIGSAQRIGIIVRRSVPGNPWAAKDVAQDRFIPVSKADAEGRISVWLLQNEPAITFEEPAVDKTPKILSALIEAPDKISVTLSAPMEATGSRAMGFVLLADGKEVPIKSVSPTGKAAGGRARSFIITTGRDLDLTSAYVLKRQGYREAAVGLGNVFSSKAFEEAFHYDGDDLGAVYTPGRTRFRVWAPTATRMEVVLYPSGQGGQGTAYPMTRDVKGTWVKTVEGDLHGKYYTYRVTIGGSVREAVDPYARAVGVNGMRGMVVDLARTNPEGWDKVAKPPFGNPTDAVIYELHVRDLSIGPESGIEHKGKFLGIVERGTRGPNGVTTGLDHLVELGITHLHLLPSFDYATVDETRLDVPQFNWGYDPLNYNVPEGSYSTDPYNGEVRIREFKEMVAGLSKAGIRLVMDVVFNHTHEATNSNLNILVPGYYYRTNPDGSLSNGSGCGNELADERSMVRKLIVDSVTWWAREYKVGGFRFDLMGLHSTATMNAVRAALDKIDPSIIVYGEGWTGGATPLPAREQSVKANIRQVPGVAAFSDEIRDGIKGGVFNATEPGFVNGRPGTEESVKFGIVAATSHPQVNYGRVAYSKFAWAASPNQTIVYCEAHDNHTLWDKLTLTNPGESEQELLKMHKMAGAIVLTSQGIPFLHAGQDFVRTKGGDHNSYKSPDSVNQLDWARKARYLDVFRYYKGLIELRKAHPAFRMTTAEDIREHLKFMDMPAPNMVGYTIGGHANGDSWKTIAVVFNAGTSDVKVELPASGWVAVVNGERAGTKALGTFEGSVITVPARTCMVLVDAGSYRAAKGR